MRTDKMERTMRCEKCGSRKIIGKYHNGKPYWFCRNPRCSNNSPEINEMIEDEEE